MVVYEVRNYPCGDTLPDIIRDNDAWDTLDEILAAGVIFNDREDAKKYVEKEIDEQWEIDDPEKEVKWDETDKGDWVAEVYLEGELDYVYQILKVEVR